MASFNEDITRFGNVMSYTYYIGTGTGTPEVNNDAPKERLQRQRVSYVHPQFRIFRKIGRALDPLPFYYRKISTGYPIARIWSGGGSTRNLNIAEGALGYFLGKRTTELLPTATEKEELLASLNNKLLLKIKDQKANFVQSFAERQQTIDLIGQTAQRLANAMRNLKKMDYTAAARDLGVAVKKRKRRSFEKSFKEDQEEAIASGWLGLQYGWKPLLDDVKGAAEYTAQKFIKEVPKLVKARSSIERQSFTKEDGYLDLDNSFTFSYSSGVFFSTPNEVSHAASQLGLTNPALIAWELMPYSFVVDWFIPIGNFLSTLDATMGVSFGGGWITSVYQGKSKTTASRFIVDSSFPSPWPVYDIREWTAESSGIEIERKALLEFPSPSFPSFKNPFSVDHVLNSLALMKTAFR